MKTLTKAKGSSRRLLRRDIGVTRLLAELAVVLLQVGLTPKHFAEWQNTRLWKPREQFLNSETAKSTARESRS